MDIIDQIKEQAMAANACYEAGLHAAADETGPAAIKLRGLIAAVEDALNHGTPTGTFFIAVNSERLRIAIEEARKP